MLWEGRPGLTDILVDVGWRSFLKKLKTITELTYTVGKANFPVHKIAYILKVMNVTQTRNTTMERKFCWLFGDIFKSCERFFYAEQFTFFWQAAETGCAHLKSN